MTRPALGVVLWVSILSLAGFAQSERDPVIGTWELNLAKSKIIPGPAPQCETRVYQFNGKQLILTISAIGADGKALTTQSAYLYDGKEYPVIGNPDIDAQTLRQIDPYNISGTMKKSGKVVQTNSRSVSKDGKILTVAFKGVNAKGQTVDQLLFYDRR
jgi:hypothetical protein